MKQGIIKEVKSGDKVVATNVLYDIYEEHDDADAIMRERATAMSRVRATNEARVGNGTSKKRLVQLVLKHGLEVAQDDAKTGQEICLLSINSSKDELMTYCEDQELLG